MFHKIPNDNGLAFIKKFITDNALRDIPDPDIIPKDDSLPERFLLSGREIVPAMDWSTEQKADYRTCKRKTTQIRNHSNHPDRIRHITDIRPRWPQSIFLRNSNSSFYMH